MIGNGRTALADALDICTADLEILIDRHFALRRTLVVEQESEKHWTASIGDDVLYRHANPARAMKWAKTFAERTQGVEIRLVDTPAEEAFSVRVAPVVELRPA